MTETIPKPQSIAEIIREASAPTGEMAELQKQVQRLRPALDVAHRWVQEATKSTEMFERAMSIEDELERELSRTLFEMEVVYDSRIFAAGRRDRGEAEDERSAEEDRRAVICNALAEAYTIMSEAASETFANYGGSDEVAVDQARYKLMGALLAAQDALAE